VLLGTLVTLAAVCVLLAMPPGEVGSVPYPRQFPKAAKVEPSISPTIVLWPLCKKGLLSPCVLCFPLEPVLYSPWLMTAGCMYDETDRCWADHAAAVGGFPCGRGPRAHVDRAPHLV
jgi:hypothetical protein